MGEKGYVRSKSKEMIIGLFSEEFINDIVDLFFASSTCQHYHYKSYTLSHHEWWFSLLDFLEIKYKVEIFWARFACKFLLIDYLFGCGLEQEFCCSVGQLLLTKSCWRNASVVFSSSSLLLTNEGPILKWWQSSIM